MKKRLQYFLYISFAVLATLINIGIQKGMELFCGEFLLWKFYNTLIYMNSKISYGLILQMGIATIISFIFKYIVDKLIIFKDRTSYFSNAHFKQVLFYGFFAIFTTLIFWTAELSFKKFFMFPNSQYVGAVIGLSIGYTVKFLLDRKYVFVNA